MTKTQADRRFAALLRQWYEHNRKCQLVAEGSTEVEIPNSSNVLGLLKSIYRAERDSPNRLAVLHAVYEAVHRETGRCPLTGMREPGGCVADSASGADSGVA